MRLPRHLGRSLVLLALALGLNALCGNAPTSRWDFAHVPRGEHRHFPSQGSYRSSSRSRRSQGRGAADVSSMEDAQHPAAEAQYPANAKRGAAFAGGGNGDLDALRVEALAAWDGAPEERRCVSGGVLVRGSAVRAPGAPRGPPLG